MQMDDGMQTDSQSVGGESNTPTRINGEMLKSGKYNGATVAIVGKFLGSNNNDNKLAFEASDGQKFSVSPDPQSQWDGYTAKFIEVLGTPQRDGSVLQVSYQEWGNEFNLETYNKFVMLTHNYPNLF